ncbi:hypothetical protein QQ045_017069 [Rhodiola kirilowii]
MSALQNLAKRCELRLSQKNEFTEECLSGVEDLLQDVYASRQPKPSDYEDRIELVGLVNEISKEIYGSSAYPTVEEYGSFVMGIFSADSDLDLSVDLTDTEAKISRDMMVKALIKFAEKFRVLQNKGRFRDLKRVLGARVPIIKATHCDSGIECDISIGNWDGIKKSKIIQIICGIDVRFQQLSFLMKEWAKAHQINSARTKTLNSLSIISLVAFHLQTREPPILPPFSTIFRDGTEPEKVNEVVREYVDFGKCNKESTADLFVSFLIKLASVKQHWSKGLCASTFYGTWILKLWSDEIGYLSVEDFSTRSQNVARAVNREQLDRICDCISNSLNHLARFKDGQIQKSQLKELLFGLVPIIGSKSKLLKRPKGRTRAQTLRADRRKKRRAERRAELEKATHEPSLAMSYTVLQQSTLLNIHGNEHAPANIYAEVSPAPTPYLTHHAGALVIEKLSRQVTAAPLSQPGIINSQNGKSVVPRVVPLPSPSLELIPYWPQSL